MEKIVGDNGGFHIFPETISPKVNVIAWLEFELANYDIVVQQFRIYAKGKTKIYL